jgi:hypothetical protein
LDSVVAVHGLYGGREDTWTTAATDDMPGSNWLKDQIHKHHPASRILTFGYDASNTRAGIATMAGISAKAFQLLDVLVELRKASDPVRVMSCPRSRTTFSESGRELMCPVSQDIFRPLVFIAHDLGGIIVKEVRKILEANLLREDHLEANKVPTVQLGIIHGHSRVQQI